MTLEEFDPTRLVRGFWGVVRRSPGSRAIATVGSWCLWLPGMRPRAPKRNVIVGLVYVYVGSIVTAVAVI
jgi:hypothetical protein